ncbi:isoamyl acetate-hydrolyzing esterase [Physocladia obscura]|uniref:Isoamyl acetate-hydrolyzing esterase n=1 Tax=Physocladia obscura TaxID=109957 RepID=A0AAD5STD5_9FUNG|nr:isoamyl acetate-hydrolyzing esterase [Physocladia obscura]
MLGANDSVHTQPNEWNQHVPLSEYKQNLHEMLAIVRAESPATRVVLITPTPIDAAAWGVRNNGNFDRSPAHTKTYRDACIEVYREAEAGSGDSGGDGWGQELVLVDSWAVFLGDGKTDYVGEDLNGLFSDGLHLAAKGNTLLALALLKAIKKSWPDLDPAALTFPITPFDKIDTDNLPNSLFSL